MTMPRGIMSVRGALVSLLISGSAMAQSVSGTNLTINTPVRTYGEAPGSTMSGSVDASTCRGTSSVTFNHEMAWGATGGQVALSSGVTTQTLVINESNKYALALGALFSSVVNNPIPAYASQTGPYYIGGVRASIQGTLSNTSLRGVVAAISAEDAINTPITFGAHIQGKSYFSDGLYVAGGASTGGMAGSFNGGLVASGFYTLSDARLKSDVRPLAPALDKLVQLQPKSYVYSGAASALPSRTGGEMGLVAQDVEKIFPQLVKQATVRDASGGIVGEYKAVDYASLIPVLIKGMQEQQDLIQAQQARLLQLEASVQRLRASGRQ